MADLTINSKVPMNSGYDIPVLSYGVNSPDFVSDAAIFISAGISNVCNPRDLSSCICLQCLKTGCRY
jgi:hypothetical protein